MELYTIKTCPWTEIKEEGIRGTLYYCKKYKQTLREGAPFCKPCLRLMNFDLKYQNLFKKDIETDTEITDSIVSSLFGGVPPEIRHCPLISVGRKYELEYLYS